MIQAKLQTQNFEFSAYGPTVSHAKNALVRGLLAHGEQYKLKNNWFEPIFDQVETKYFEQCACYRDNEYIRGQK